MYSARIASALGCLLAILPAQDESLTAQFTCLNNTFLIDLPRDFRQLAPNEALRLAENAATPREWRSTSPRSYYAVGPIDRWLAGDLGTPWLYVLEQGREWHTADDFPKLLAERWRDNGDATGVSHELSDLREAQVGPQGHEVWLAERTSTPAEGRPVHSIDIYAPTGGRQVTLTMCAWADEFDRYRPEFDRWLASLTFSRPSRGEQTLTDRLWTPLLTGGLVGLVLLALYKHNKRSR